MGLAISALTSIQYLGKEVEIIKREDHDDIVMYEGEPTTNFIQIEHAGYPMHAGVLVDGGYYYYSDSIGIDITYSAYGEFIDCVLDFFDKKKIPNTLINLTNFTDCQGVISNKMCMKICGAIYYAVYADSFRCNDKNAKFLFELVNVFQKAAAQNGIIVYW